MRKIIIKTVYTICVFLATIIIMEFVTRHNVTASSEDMQRPSLPVVSMISDGIEYNEMHGYINERDPSRYHADIAPVSSDRHIDVSIDPYGELVSSMNYEIWDISGSRLVEEGSLSDIDVKDGGVTRAGFTMQSIVEENTEYLLTLIISTEDIKDIRYYSRIICSDSEEVDENGQNNTDRILEFTDSFHRSALTKRNKDELNKYLESSNDSNANSYENVDITSSYDQVTYGDMAPRELVKPIWNISSCLNGIYSIDGSYVVTVEDSDKNYHKYLCKEYYRLYEGSERFFLLDYERTMTELFEPDSSNYDQDVLKIGICSDSIEVMSDESSNIAFVCGQRLYALSIEDESIAYVFGFSDPDTTDRRELYDEHKIRILRVTEEGNIDFAVYGYMNCGRHEGQTGVAEYTYDKEGRTVEEKAFVNYEGSPELLIHQVDDGLYLTESGLMYVLIDGSLYEIDTNEQTTRMIRDNLESKGCLLSTGGRLAAYEDTDETTGNAVIVVLDLDDLSEKKISLNTGEKGTPIGFFGEDLIYGVSRDSDAYSSSRYGSIVPMYSVRIVDPEMELLENYEETDFYITDCVLGEGQITLHRLQKIAGEDGSFSYSPAADDQIISGQKDKSSSGLIKTVSDQLLGEVVNITASGFDGESVRYIRPMELYYDSEKEIDTDTEKDEKVKTRYYVYDMHGLDDYYDDFRIAITRAADERGSVVDNTGAEVYQSVFKSVAEIESISSKTGIVSDDPLKTCLEEILAYEGYSQPEGIDLTSDDSDAVKIINEKIKGAKAEYAPGVSLDDILYYVSIYRPVLAFMKDGNAVLIDGYSDKNIILFDPMNGGRRVVARSEAKSMFEDAGNIFIVYIVE